MKRRICLQVLCCLGVLLLHSGARAQYLQYHNAHRLVGADEVYHVSRDRAGFLWFCTNRGVIKYNGRTTRRFTTYDGLPDKMVFNTYEDRSGRLWLFCYNGQYCYIRNDTVHNAGNDALLAALPFSGSYLVGMAESEDAALYLGFRAQKILRVDKQHAAWMPVTGKMPYIRVRSTDIIYTNRWGNSIMLANNRVLMDIDAQGFGLYDKTGHILRVDNSALSNNTVTDACLSSDGWLLIGTSHGLEIMHTKSGERQLLLKGKRISSCEVDVAGNYWITTNNGEGIYKLHRELQGIHPVDAFRGVMPVEVNDGISVCIKDSVFYELRMDGAAFSLRRIIGGVQNYFNPLLLTDSLAVFYDTWHGYTVAYNKHTGDTFSEHRFYKWIYPYKDNRFLCVDNYGIYSVARGNESLRPEHTQSFLRKIVASCQDPQQRDVYFVSDASLYQYHFPTGITKRLFQAPQLRATTALTLQDGVFLLATDAPRYYILTLSDMGGGLDSQVCPFPVRKFTCMGGRSLFQTDGGFYLRTAEGGKEHLQKIVYPLSSDDFEFLMIQGANCIVKTDESFYSFDTSLLNRHMSLPAVYLERLIINGTRYTANNIRFENTTRLNIQLSVGVLNFSSGSHTIAYRVKGMQDAEWNYTDATDFELLLDKPGDYILEIRSGDIPLTTGSALAIALHVRTPFLQSTNFTVLCTLAAVLCAAVIFSLINRYRKRHFTRELNYLKLEHRAMNALLNPHFVFNSINNIQNLIHKTEGHDAAEYLATLSRLIRQNLENLQYNFIPLEDELALIRRYVKLQNLRFGGRLHLQTSVSNDDLLQSYMPPLLLHSFVENAIVHGMHNRIQPLHIEIVICPEADGYLRIMVTDDGVGLHAAKTAPSMHNKTSMGIAFNRKRLQRLSQFYKLRQSVEVADRADEGTAGTRVTCIMYARLAELFERHHLPVR